MTKKRFKQKPADINELMISRYSFRVWKRAYPESTRLEWFTTQQPYSMSLFVQDIMEAVIGQININSLENIKMLPLNDAFTKWASEHPEEEISGYKVDDDKIDEIMLEEDMLYDYHLVVLPIITISEAYKDETRTNFMLDEQTWKKIDEYFSEIFGENGFVFHYLMRIDDIYNDQEVLYTAAKAFFEDNMRVKLDKYLEQDRVNRIATIYKLGIPIITKGDTNSGIINVPEFLRHLGEPRNSPEDMMLEAKALEERGVSSAKSFKDSEAFQIICNLFGERAAVGTYLEAACNLPAFNEEAIKSFRNLVRSQNYNTKASGKRSRENKLSARKC